MVTIGERIKRRRNELKWSQRELSDRMGYGNHSTITKIEAGKVDIPQSRIVQFADVLGVSVAYLMGWEESIQKKPVEMAEIHVEMIRDEDLMEMLPDFWKLDKREKQIVKNLVHDMAEEKTEA